MNRRVSPTVHRAPPTAPACARATTAASRHHAVTSPIAAHAMARAERRHARRNPKKKKRKNGKRPRRGNPSPFTRSNPKELVSVTYREKKPGDAMAYDYEHDFRGKRPELKETGRGRLEIRGGSYSMRDGWIHG